ncbi:MAG: hypothetical protein ACREQ2_25190 [Candidatus Binatia bacterium]
MTIATMASARVVFAPEAKDAKQRAKPVTPDMRNLGKISPFGRNDKRDLYPLRESLRMIPFCPAGKFMLNIADTKNQ